MLSHKRIAGLIAGFFMLPAAAHAIDGKVYSPDVVKGEAEIEYAGTDTFDSDKSKNAIQEHQFSVGYAPTDFWATEVYFATFERGPGQPIDYTANEFENIFQLTPQGKYWLDAGILASYHFAAKADAADSVELKLLLQKDIGPITAIANIGAEREVGSHAEAGNDISSAINARYRWKDYFQPGLELQSGYGKLGDRASYNQQEQYLGPIAYGQIIPGLKYEAGYFAGISTASASSAMRLKLEYEMFF
ncbi:MAG TPA: hypothetical protein VFT64_06775 [Rickettsiales bacterium]|nr:hypothetical protein [Rickettsiales bacterium]